MSVNDLIAEGVSLFKSNNFAQAIVKFNQAWSEIKDKNSQLEEQNYILFSLGLCHCKLARKTKNEFLAPLLFVFAIIYHKTQLELAKKQTDEQKCIRTKIYAQFGLGYCYLEQAIQTKNVAKANEFLEQAIECYQQFLHLTNDLKNYPGRTILEKIVYSDFNKISFLKKEWRNYFNNKKKEICGSLFSDGDERLNKELENAVSSVLAVLHIPPIELGSTPLAHYTSSIVCNKLFGVVNEDDSSPMRIGSSSYMNDPSEGEGLLELLKLQDLELENKADCSPYNAFFACFSSRVNDLNQFRLYGKEDGVEASGACLVFNKYGNWLKEPDILAPFRSFIKNQGDNLAEFKETNISNVEYEKLPLYQVAYIAYKDEYITKEKCEIWLDNLKFGICLKPIGENNDWHNFRLNQLKEALQELVGFFKEKEHVNDKNKNALEYIRYLFKDFAFRDEEEFRVLKMAEIDSEEIEYCKTTKSIYLPYADISNVVDEVILGTNYEKTNSRRKAEVFQHQMRQKCPNVKVSRSSLPIYANPPIKKD